MHRYKKKNSCIHAIDCSTFSYGRLLTPFYSTIFEIKASLMSFQAGEQNAFRVKLKIYLRDILWDSLGMLTFRDPSNVPPNNWFFSCLS